MKRILCLLLAVSLLLSLAACGGSPAHSVPPASAASSAPTQSTPASVDVVSAPDTAAGGESAEQSVPPSEYTGSFELAGMWADEEGTILTFNANGSVGPVLFGFEGGPDGSWAISSGTNTAGHYTLQTSHITGGSPKYIVRLISADEIELYAESGVNFGREYYHLTRQ